MTQEFLESLVGGASSPLLIAVLFAVTMMACATQYTAIGMSGFGPYRWRAFTAMGWTLLVIRFVLSYTTIGAVPTLPPVAALSVMLIAAGAVLRNIADSSCMKLPR
jgi:hypothetical protein